MNEMTRCTYNMQRSVLFYFVSFDLSDLNSKLIKCVSSINHQNRIVITLTHIKCMYFQALFTVVHKINQFFRAMHTDEYILNLNQCGVTTIF